MNASVNTRLLFVCTGNIARSQIAEGLARSLARPEVEVASAGSRPNPKGMHRFAVEVLRERGIDAAGQRPKAIAECAGEFDYVITLCDVATTQCPALSAMRERIHWSIPDPALAGEDPTAQLAFFRDVREDLDRRLRDFLGARGLLRASS